MSENLIQDIEECSENESEDKKEIVTKDYEVEDKYCIVHVVFFFIGLVNIISGFYFVTAFNYWMFKFRDVNSHDINHKNALQKNFSSTLSVVDHISMILGSFWTKFYGHNYNYKYRLYIPLTAIFTVFTAAASLVYVDTDFWQLELFIVTMIEGSIINISNGVFIITAYELISTFPQKYLTSFLVGQGFAKVFTAMLMIFSIFVGTSMRSSAMIYFLVGVGIIVLMLVLLVLVQNYDFYKFYALRTAEIQKDSMPVLISALKTIWSTVVTFQFLAAGVTILTNVITLVLSESAGKGKWPDSYFNPVLAYLLCNAMEVLGRIIGGRVRKDFGPLKNMLFIIVRLFVFTALFMLCNAQPRSHLPVVFPHDYQYIIIVIVFSLSGGYFYIIVWSEPEKLLPPEKVNAGLSILYLVTIIVGIVTSSLSFLLVNML